MLWLGVHLPDLGLEIFQQRQAQGPLRPAVLAEDGRVRLVDAQARNAGIAVGCTLATALSIAQDLIYFERDEAAENQRLGTLGSHGPGLQPAGQLSFFRPAAGGSRQLAPVRRLGRIVGPTEPMRSAFRSCGQHRRRPYAGPPPWPWPRRGWQRPCPISRIARNCCGGPDKPWPPSPWPARKSIRAALNVWPTWALTRSAPWLVCLS